MRVDKSSLFLIQHDYNTLHLVETAANLIELSRDETAINRNIQK
jgi:hypothetical protein